MPRTTNPVAAHGTRTLARRRAGRVLAALLLLIQAAALAHAAAQTTVAAEGRAAAPPNFVVILVDDAALMDFGAYGGEARTPHIDQLAARGARFNHYRTSPLCAPSRAMLLTGLDNHLTGVATIPEVLPAEQRGKPGYAMRLEPGVRTIATRLREHGYRTLMTGKWHLGNEPGALPDAHGFDRSFVLDASGADNWDQKPYMPYYQHADWFEDGRPAQLPHDFYSSEFLVDRMIQYLDQAPADQPFFAYLAFQAIHIPVQAPREFTARYLDTYAEGWEALRERRLERARVLGLIGSEASSMPLRPPLRPWNSLTPEEQAVQVRSMAVNAGMLDAMDHHVGRLIAHLRATGRFDNTIFVVSSDNGPEPSDPLAARGMATWLSINGYDRELETFGERGSYVFIGPEWAWAAATPSDLFKFYTKEGGVRAPLIVAGPGIAAGATIDATSFVTDVTPTLLDFAGVQPEPEAFTGRTLRPVLEGSSAPVYRPDEPVGMEVSGNAALFKGHWKLARNLPPWGSGDWELFDMAIDPGETRDRAAEEPELFDELKADYADYAARVGVLEMPEGYDMQRQIGSNSMAKQVAAYRTWILLGAAAVIALGVALALWGRLSRRA